MLANSSRSKSLLILLVLLAASEFIVRGPVRFLRAADFNDFISPYIQSRAMIEGMDPYSPEILVQLWPTEGTRRPDFIAKDLAEGTLIMKRGIPTAYPLTCLLMLAPLAIMPWPVAHLAWLAINICLILVLIWSLLKWCGFERNDWRGYVFVAFSLALAPLNTGVATGSIVIPTVALCGLALSRDQRVDSEIFAGILFGIAVCWKPQIGLPFLAYYLLRKRWRLCGIAFGVVFTAAMLAMGRLAISGTSWLQNYQTDNKILFASGILSDFTERNPMRFSLINLQVLLYAGLHRVFAANLLALAVSAALFGIWVVLVMRTDSLDALLPVSAIVVLSLLPVYHRFYDAVLLIFPIAWSLRDFSLSKKHFARGTFLLTVPFLIPGGSILEQLELRGQIPGAIRWSWYWIRIAMPHQIWLLLLLSVLLLWRMAAGSKRTTAVDTPISSGGEYEAI